MGKPGTEFVTGSVAEKKLFTFWSPPVYFTMVIRVIIADKLNIVSFRRKPMLEESVLVFEDTSPFLVIPPDGAGMLTAGGCTGFPVAVHNDGVGNWCILDRRVVNNLLGDPPYADVVVTLFLEALKPILCGAISSQRHEWHTKTIGGHRNGNEYNQLES